MLPTICARPASITITPIPHKRQCLPFWFADGLVLMQLSCMEWVRKLLRLDGKYPGDPKSVLQNGLARQLGLRTAIHVGAHRGQERDYYEGLGFTDVLWVEASVDLYRGLTEHLAESTGKTSHVAVNAFVSDTFGETVSLRHFSNDGASNSLFPATRRLGEKWPDVHDTGTVEEVLTAKLDDIAEKHGFSRSDFLNIDVQGAELMVLRGGTSVLAQAKCVITEVSTVPFYEGGVLYPELQEFMLARGFKATQDPPDHGDMLFRRT